MTRRGAASVGICALRGALALLRGFSVLRRALEVHPKMGLTKSSMAILNTLCTDTFDKAAPAAAHRMELALGVENTVSSLWSVRNCRAGTVRSPADVL